MFWRNFFSLEQQSFGSRWMKMIRTYDIHNNLYFECLWLFYFALNFAILWNACRYLIANLELYQYYQILRNCLEFSIVFAKRFTFINYSVQSVHGNDQIKTNEWNITGQPFCLQFSLFVLFARFRMYVYQSEIEIERARTRWRFLFDQINSLLLYDVFLELWYALEVGDIWTIHCYLIYNDHI